MPQSWQNGVTAYYAFNPLLVDATLRGNTLTQDPLNDNPVTQVAGIVSQAASFDGGNDLFAANDTDVSPPGSFTFAFWFKQASSIFPVNLGTYDGANAGFQFTGGGLQMTFSIYPSVNDDAGGSVSASFVSGAWNLAVCTFNAVTLDITLQINNGTVHTSPGSDNPSGYTPSTAVLSLGTSQGGISMKGLLAEVAIVGRVWSAAEAGQFWNGGAGTTWSLSPLLPTITEFRA